MFTYRQMKPLFKIIVPLLFLFSSFLFLSLINHSDTDDPRIEKIVSQVKKFGEQNEQQKAYLQTDKEIYLAGENIWIKAYLINANTFQSDTVSREIFVELLDPGQRVACNIILRNRKGVSEGNIHLRDSLMDGNYQLRVYTKWMSNFDPDFFFFKTIRIKNPGYADIITKSRLENITRLNADIRKKENEFVVTFFPEGGDLIADLSSLVAFKAENNLGTPQDIRGVVLDNKGKEVVSFSSAHDGMGTFSIQPHADIKYKAKVTFSNGDIREYPIPRVLSEGITMSADPSDKDNIKLRIRPGKNSTGNIIVVAQSRSQIHYISKGEIKGKDVLTILPKKLFPPGITQITIFNNEGEPVCERLVFIHPVPGVNIGKVEIASAPINDSTTYKIKVSPNNGNLSSGNLSLSVVENLPDKENTADENILTNLLLTSDIKGRVNNPSYYFDPHNSNASNYLDLVMLTNGWRRFVWKDLLADKFPPINYSRVDGITVSGTVFGDYISQTIPNSSVILSVLNKLDYKLKTTTDFKGRFEFPAIEFEDSAYIKIETVNSSEEKSRHISLDEITSPNSITNPSPLLNNESYDKSKLKENTKQENLKRKKNPKIKSKQENTTSFRYYNPSFVLKAGDNANGYNTLLEFISGKIPGVTVSNDQILIRGSRSINLGNDPLFIYDGGQIDMTTLKSLIPSQIDRIEVVKGDDAAAFGSKGSNGVLVFYSRGSGFTKSSSIELKLAGYQKTREFYIPPYQSWAYKPENFGVPRTIFWEPNIILDSKGEAVVRFKKGIAAEKISITLEGLTDSGEIIYKGLKE